jgi:hypothetical protein
MNLTLTQLLHNLPFQCITNFSIKRKKKKEKRREVFEEEGGSKPPSSQ